MQTLRPHHGPPESESAFYQNPHVIRVYMQVSEVVKAPKDLVV